MTTNTPLRWNPMWTFDATQEPAALIAGSDRRLSLEALDPALRDAVTRWCNVGVVDAESTTEERRLIERLMHVNAIVAMPPTSDARSSELPATPGVEIVAGPGAEDLVGQLRDLLADVSAERALTVIVRGGSDWPTPPRTAHLAVDASMHHTVVIGPYVVPGLTSCTTCLDIRMSRRWEAVTPPPAPGVQRWPALIAELVRVQIELIEMDASPLVNATMVWNFEHGESERQTLLKMPGCSTCAQAGSMPLAPETEGRIPLPWKSLARQ